LQSHDSPLGYIIYWASDMILQTIGYAVTPRRRQGWHCH
jgi:hypothetical protein